MFGRLTHPASLWAFAVAVMFVPRIFDGPVMPRWWAVALGLPVVSRLDPRSLSPVVGCCFAGLLAWAAFSLIWSPVLYGGMLPLFLLLLLVAVAVAGSERRDRDAVHISFAIGIGFSSVIAIGQHYFGYSPVVEDSPPAGLFYNSEVLAETAAPMFVWCFWKKLWPLAALMAVPLALCHSRIGLFVAAVGLTWGLRPRLRFVVLGFLGLAMVGLLIFTKTWDTGERVLLWGTAIRSMTFFGRGLGWWFQAHPFGQEEYAHSDVLQAFVELGFGGLFLVAIPVVVFWKRCVCAADFGGRTWCHLSGVDCLRAERAAFVGCTIEAAVSFPLHLPAQGFLFALLAGVLARRRDSVHADGLSRGVDHGAGLRRFATYAAAMAFGSGLFGARVPVRSALAQHENLGAFGSREGDAVT